MKEFRYIPQMFLVDSTWVDNGGTGISVTEAARVANRELEKAGLLARPKPTSRLTWLLIGSLLNLFIVMIAFEVAR